MGEHFGEIILRILFASSSSGSRGGGELFLLLLGKQLALRGHEVMLWASRHPRMDELCEAFAHFGTVHRADYTNMYDHRARCYSVFFHRKAVDRIAAQWRGLAPDVLHLNKQNLEDAFDLQRAVARSGLSSVATVHITQSARYLGARLAFLRDALARHELRKYSGTFVVIQGNRKRELAAFVDDDRIVAIENGVEQIEAGNQRTALRERCGASGLLFICTARMEEQKRPLLFVEWAVRLREHFPEAKFVWIGDGRLASSWDSAVRSAGAESYILRMGWQKEVGPWLGAADIFLHTARYESFLPLSVLEAMSARLPIVMPPDLMADIPFLQTNPRFVLPLDADLPAVLGDSDRVRTAADCGFELWQNHFSASRMTDDYERLYREVR